MMPGKKRIHILMLTLTVRGKSCFKKSNILLWPFLVCSDCWREKGLKFWFLFTLYAMIKSQYMLIVFLDCKPYSNIHTFLKLHTCFISDTDQNL